MANEYVTRVAFKKTLSLSSETFADDDIDQSLEAASRAIDDLCGRRFYADADAAQIRYYRPINRELVRIDDLVTLTSLASDPGGDGVFEETWTLNTDFTLGPDNADANGRPWEIVRRHPRGNYLFQPDYPRTVKVTGKFGWAAVPPAIKEATTILTSKLLKRKREHPMGIVISAETAMRIATGDPDVSMLLKGYGRGGTRGGMGFV